MSSRSSRTPPPKPTLIERQQQVDVLCQQCRSDGAFAFDTEFVMEDRFEAQACLIQIATRSGVTLVDPLAGLDLTGLWNLVADEQVRTIVHAGQEDVAFCVRQTGRVPRSIFDVQIAAGLVGCDYPLSLQKLVHLMQHVRLHKAKTLTNWRKRPLSPEQLRYAVGDVYYLLNIYDQLAMRLGELNRLDWAREEFQRFEDLSIYRRTEEDKIARVKGAGALRGRELVILGELLAWRESLAERVNRPARVVLRDHLLVEVAKHRIKTSQELRSLRGLNLGGKELDAVCRVVEQALTIPESDWPQRKPREAELPHQAGLIALASSVIRSHCMEHHLAYPLVATQKSIGRLVRYCSGDQSVERDSVALLSGWRSDWVGTMISEVIRGRRSVRVEQVDGSLVVRADAVDPPTHQE